MSGENWNFFPSILFLAHFRMHNKYYILCSVSTQKMSGHREAQTHTHTHACEQIHLIKRKQNIKTKLNAR